MTHQAAQHRPQGNEPVLSVVCPMFNEESALPHFVSRIAEVLEPLLDDFEIVCVNDGSSDGTLAALRDWAARDARVKVVDLSRNFGKEAALSAGLDFARGQAVVPIDVDLQDPPELIGEMLDLWRVGNDVVLAARHDRASDPRLKRATAGWFYTLMARISDIDIPANVGDFRLMDRQVVEALKRLPERARFMKGIFAWLGFRTATISFARPMRSAGEAKQRYGRLARLAIDGVVSFTTFPLRIWTLLGVLLSTASAIYMLVIIVRTLVFGNNAPGYASIMTVLLFFNGMIMINLGVLGEYIARIFVEVKNRPIYLVRETVNLDGPDAVRPRDR
jgi:glycosyltransferase involved in cell wall biosynthesis